MLLNAKYKFIHTKHVKKRNIYQEIDLQKVLLYSYILLDISKFLTLGNIMEYLIKYCTSISFTF